MGRQVNEASITTKNARTKLPARKPPYWRAIDRGAHLGYRKNLTGGTWVIRYRRPDRTYITKAIGAADDALEPDGKVVLSYSQALVAARRWCEQQNRPRPSAPFTVADAMREYLAWYARHRKSLYEVTRRAEVHILPELGEIAVADLDTKTIRRWHEALAAAPPRLRSSAGGPQRTREAPTDPEGQRARRATANKVLVIFRAALNHAFREGHVASDHAWRRVVAFRNVDAPQVRYLTEAEITRLVNACPRDFRQLVRAALLTGCRYGELVAMRCSDFSPDPETAMVYVRTAKSGKARHVVLSDEGRRFFERVVMGRPGNALMLLRADSRPWGKSHQRRPLAEACRGAHISPPVTFHALRHTHASHLAMRGVPLMVIAHQLGHSDGRMVERHYAHLSSSYISDAIRDGLPDFGIVEADEAVQRLGKR